MSDEFSTAEGLSSCEDDSSPPDLFRLPVDSMVDQLDFFIAPAGISGGKYFRHSGNAEQHNDVEGEMELCPICLSSRRYFACQSCILKMPGRPRKKSQKAFGKLLALQRSLAHKNESLGVAVEAAITTRLKQQQMWELKALTQLRLNQVKAAINLKRANIAESRQRLDETTERRTARAARLAKLEEYNAKNFSGRSNRLASSRRECARRIDTTTRDLVSLQNRYIREMFDFVYPLSVCPVSHTPVTNPTSSMMTGSFGMKFPPNGGPGGYHPVLGLEQVSEESDHNRPKKIGGCKPVSSYPSEFDNQFSDITGQQNTADNHAAGNDGMTDSTQTLQLSQGSLQLLTATLTSSGGSVLGYSGSNRGDPEDRPQLLLGGSNSANTDSCRTGRRSSYAGPLSPQMSNHSSSCGSCTSTLGGRSVSNDDILAALADATMTNFDGEQWVYYPTEPVDDYCFSSVNEGAPQRSGGLQRPSIAAPVAYRIGHCYVPDRSLYGALRRWLFVLPTSDPVVGLGGPASMGARSSSGSGGKTANPINRTDGSVVVVDKESFHSVNRNRSSTDAQNHKGSANSLQISAAGSGGRKWIPIASSASADNLPLQLSSGTEQLADEIYRATGTLAGLGNVAQISQILGAIYDVQLPYPYLVSSCFSSKPMKTSASVGAAYEAGAMLGETGYNQRGRIVGIAGGSRTKVSVGRRLTAPAGSGASAGTAGSLTEAAFDTALIQLNANVGSICFAKGPDLPFELIGFDRPLNNLRQLRGLVDQSSNLTPSSVSVVLPFGARKGGATERERMGDVGFSPETHAAAGGIIIPSDVISACPEWSAGFLRQFETTVDRLETWEDPGGQILFPGSDGWDCLVGVGTNNDYHNRRNYSGCSSGEAGSYDNTGGDEYEWESINDTDAMRIPSWEPPEPTHRRGVVGGTPPPAGTGLDHDGQPSLIDHWLTGATHSVTSFLKSMGGSRAGL